MSIFNKKAFIVSTSEHFGTLEYCNGQFNAYFEAKHVLLFGVPLHDIDLRRIMNNGQCVNIDVANDRVKEVRIGYESSQLHQMIGDIIQYCHSKYRVVTQDITDKLISRAELLKSNSHIQEKKLIDCPVRIIDLYDSWGKITVSGIKGLISFQRSDVCLFGIPVPHDVPLTKIMHLGQEVKVDLIHNKVVKLYIGSAREMYDYIQFDDLERYCRSIRVPMEYIHKFKHVLDAALMKESIRTVSKENSETVDLLHLVQQSDKHDVSNVSESELIDTIEILTPLDMDVWSPLESSDTDSAIVVVTNTESVTSEDEDEILELVCDQTVLNVKSKVVQSETSVLQECLTRFLNEKEITNSEELASEFVGYFNKYKTVTQTVNSEQRTNSSNETKQQMNVKSKIRKCYTSEELKDLRRIMEQRNMGDCPKLNDPTTTLMSTTTTCFLRMGRRRLRGCLGCEVCDIWGAENARTVERDAGEQKQMLGERLFPIIECMYPELAGKITGMLLKIDNSELLHLLEHRKSLEIKVEEAVAVLHQVHKAKQQLQYLKPSRKNTRKYQNANKRK